MQKLNSKRDYYLNQKFFIILLFFYSFYNFLTILFISTAMVTSQYTFEFLYKMPHNLREEFKNEFARRFEDIKIKEYKNRQSDHKVHDNIPFYYTVLVAYAQKCS